MEVNYVVMDPSGNVTILVETAVPAADRPAIANALMARESAAEQVGFLSAASDADVALDMAGGEFCGNATMSAAVWQTRQTDRSEGRLYVRASGAEAPVPVDLQRQEDGAYIASLAMPQPRSVQKEPLPGGGEVPVVRFDGISHVILEQDLGKSAAEKLVKEWAAHWGEDALGLLMLDLKRSRMTPLVYVPAADTLCWEHACGSGTAAVGAWLARESGHPVALTLQQPGGLLTVAADPAGALQLSGSVKSLYRRQVNV